MDSPTRKERPCIFFLLTLFVGFGVVAVVACEAVHLFLQLKDWPMYLGVAVAVAALAAGVSRLMHFLHERHEDGSGHPADGTRIAH